MLLIRLKVVGRSLDEISTGRISVWKAYIKQSSLFGHNEPYGVYLYMPNIGLDAVIDTPHNAILQIYYNHGIFAGVAYLCYVVLSFRFAKKNRDSEYALEPFAIAVGYLVFGLTNSMTPAFLCPPTLLFYFIQFPLWKKEEK